MKARVVLCGVFVIVDVLTACAGSLPANELEGFSDWTGFEQENWIRGRCLSASDLRHRISVVLVIRAGMTENDITKFGDELRRTGDLAKLASRPDFAFAWDLAETFPRECLVAVSVQGACTADAISQAVKKRKDDGKKSTAKAWNSPEIGFYANVEKVGDVDIRGQLPYVYVMGPSGTEPLWKGKYEKKDFLEIKRIVSKATRALVPLVPLTGVSDPQFFQTEKEELIEGKSANDVMNRLRKSLVLPDAAKAKEALLMFDAICQYRSDLLYRISQEMTCSPARAYADVQRFLVLYPQDKKQVKRFQVKLNEAKQAITVGKIMEKYVRWTDSSFVFKNVVEAKKATKQMISWRKTLEKVAKDQSEPAVAGEASLLLAQLDGIADVLMSKVAQ